MRFAALIEYLGSNYQGWQRQAHSPNTIQQQLEGALSQVANEAINLVCAGRTDAGVHATGQIIHFDTQAQRRAHNWIMGANHHLPQDIRIKAICPCSDDFHARFDAQLRQYDYFINIARYPSALYAGRALHLPQPLDINAMQQACQYLLGEHDFSSFRAAGCQAKSAVRQLHVASISQRQDLICCRFQANAFLYHMVRNLVGSLIVIGRQQASVAWIQRLLDVKDRSQAAATAPAHALYLSGVTYAVKYQRINQLSNQRSPSFF